MVQSAVLVIFCYTQTQREAVEEVTRLKSRISDVESQLDRQQELNDVSTQVGDMSLVLLTCHQCQHVTSMSVCHQCFVLPVLLISHQHCRYVIIDVGMSPVLLTCHQCC